MDLEVKAEELRALVRDEDNSMDDRIEALQKLSDLLDTDIAMPKMTEHDVEIFCED